MTLERSALSLAYTHNSCGHAWKPKCCEDFCDNLQQIPTQSVTKLVNSLQLLFAIIMLSISTIIHCKKQEHEKYEQ